MTKILSTITVVLGAATAAFADMPYSWAHIVGVGLGAAIAGLHGVNAATTTATKGTSNDKPAS